MQSSFSPDRLTPAQVATLCGVNTSTVWRWLLTGIKGGVRLESYCEGAKRYIPVEALDRFRAACTAASVTGHSAPSGKTPAQRQREIERAERELAELGV